MLSLKEGWISTSDAARLMSTHPNTVRRLCSRGLIEGVQLYHRGAIFVSSESVVAYMESVGDVYSDDAVARARRGLSNPERNAAP